MYISNGPQVFTRKKTVTSRLNLPKAMLLHIIIIYNGIYVHLPIYFKMKTENENHSVHKPLTTMNNLMMIFHRIQELDFFFFFKMQSNNHLLNLEDTSGTKSFSLSLSRRTTILSKLQNAEGKALLFARQQSMLCINRDERGEAELRHGGEHSGHYGSNLQLFYSS